MKTKIKLSIMSALFALLTFASVAHSQNLDYLFPMPAKEFQSYSAGTVGTANTRKTLYIGKYYFPDTKPKYGFLGIFITQYGSILSAVNLQLYTGYKAEVCGTFAGTSRYLCVPKFVGLNSLKEFSDVDEITISKLRNPDEVVLWISNPSRPIAKTLTNGTITNPNNEILLDPYAAWVPAGYWLRLCKSKTPARGQCGTYTSDRSNFANRPYEYIRVGKGNPPPEPQPSILIIKPESDTKQLKYPPSKVPKPKPLPKPKTKRLP